MLAWFVVCDVVEEGETGVERDAQARGVLFGGRLEPIRGMMGWRLDWWVSRGERVTDDLGAESSRPFSSAQAMTSEA